jgi:hypothetical protein
MINSREISHTDDHATQRSRKPNGDVKMTFKSRLIAVGVGASLVAVASIAVAQTSAQTTPGPGQQTTEPRAHTTDHITIEHCNRVMGWSQ